MLPRKYHRKTEKLINIDLFVSYFIPSWRLLSMIVGLSNCRQIKAADDSPLLAK